MKEHQIVDSSCTAIINASIEKIDIPAWCFSLPESEYQGCSPAHVSAGFTTAPDGTRMSINVEIIGGSLMVQHFVETLGDKNHLILRPRRFGKRRRQRYEHLYIRQRHHGSARRRPL